MKKALFSLIIFAFMALTASAQIGGFTIPADSITYHSARVQAQRTVGIGNGNWHARSYIRQVGTTQFRDSLVDIPDAINSVLITWDSLLPMITYETYYVFYTNNYSDSSELQMDVFTTATAPGQATMSLYGQPRQLLPASHVLFQHNAPGNYWRAFGRCAPTYNPCTDTVMVIGNGIDSVDLPNAPGQPMPRGFIEYQFIGVVPPGINPVGQTSFWNAFTAPSHTLPKTMGLTANVVYVDSVKLMAYDSVGSGGAITSTYELMDSNYVLLANATTTTFATSQYTSASFRNLAPGSKYYGRHKVITSGIGQDTARVMFYTAAVNAPIPSVTQTAHTLNSVTLDFSFNSNGNWPGSMTDTFILYRNGVPTVYLTAILGIAPFHVVQTNLTPNTQYVYTGLLKNKFGRSTIIPAFTVSTDAVRPGFLLQFGSAQPTGFTIGTVTNLTYSIQIGRAHV